MPLAWNAEAQVDEPRGQRPVVVIAMDPRPYFFAGHLLIICEQELGTDESDDNIICKFYVAQVLRTFAALLTYM